MATVILYTVLTYLASLTVMEAINWVLKTRDEFSVILKTTLFAFWITVIAMGIVFGGAGVLTTLATAYLVSNLIARK